MSGTHGAKCDCVKSTTSSAAPLVVPFVFVYIDIHGLQGQLRRRHVCKEVYSICQAIKDRQSFTQLFSSFSDIFLDLSHCLVTLN